jgi:hypothetical protein
MRLGERGQASVEWIGLLLLVAVALAVAVAFVPAVDGRPLGAAIARALVCAVKNDCDSEAAALRRAYGERDAALVRRHAPSLVYEPGTLTLPVDYRRCRSHRCSDAPDDRDLDVHRSARGGAHATAFTHVVRRGGKTYIQYWLYYPDSPSTFMHSHGILKTLGIKDPAFHPDDWEAFTVRIDAAGRIAVRASAHLVQEPVGPWQWVDARVAWQSRRPHTDAHAPARRRSPLRPGMARRRPARARDDSAWNTTGPTGDARPALIQAAQGRDQAAVDQAGVREPDRRYVLSAITLDL